MSEAELNSDAATEEHWFLSGAWLDFLSILHTWIQSHLTSTCAPDYRHALLHSSQTYQRGYGSLESENWEPVLINSLPMINALLQVFPYEQAKLQEIQLNKLNYQANLNGNNMNTYSGFM